MKRITGLLIIAIIAVVSLQAQNPDKANTQQKVKEYFETNVYPDLQKQQEKYISSLTDDEKEKITKFREQKPGVNNRGNGHPGFCFDQVKEITGNYTELNEAYANFIDKNTEKWISDIDEIHSNDNIEPFKDRDGFTGYGEFIKRLSQPEFLLLWNSEQPMMEGMPQFDNRGPGMGNRPCSAWMDNPGEPQFDRPGDRPYGGQGNGMANCPNHFNHRGNFQRQQNSNDRPCGDPGNCMGDRQGRHGWRNPQQGPGMNPQMDEYFQENVLPVISSERESFDKKLSKKEKQTIAEARTEMAERKAEFDKWRESEDFEPGKRANDPAFDEQRKDMQDNMAKVRDIAMVHRDDLYTSLDNIRENSSPKDNEVTESTNNDRPGKPCQRRFDKGNDIYQITPVEFLLFDSENPELPNTKMGNNKPGCNGMGCNGRRGR